MSVTRFLVDQPLNLIKNNLGSPSPLFADESAVPPVVRPLPGRRLDDVVHPQDHLGRLGRREQHLPLHRERLRDAHLRHVAHRALVHVWKKWKWILSTLLLQNNFAMRPDLSMILRRHIHQVLFFVTAECIADTIMLQKQIILRNYSLRSGLVSETEVTRISRESPEFTCNVTPRFKPSIFQRILSRLKLGESDHIPFQQEAHSCEQLIIIICHLKSLACC